MTARWRLKRLGESEVCGSAEREINPIVYALVDLTREAITL